ncbi:OTU domain-containing protein 7B-like isoform X1 [Plodia interpunctella]|uniref:OTU domain-containing protein 7B-like isoform X1 n=2 Tax=Plodia interpunctella TaxID=58824 RepID=UPI00236869B9|nr:OTU domain-containing protein 7B-like isoform X1 [Plodia interpunctella]XP_053611275.1 OTU domain-containing protein 7B-like isoform X1 [Plodia interpunctella]
MVMEADPISGKRTDDRHSAPLRPRAGGDVIAPSVSSLDLNMQYSAPSNLVLTPAPECRKLSRGISRATDNEGLVWALRSNTEPDLNTLSSDHILLLPDISVYPPDFRTFIEKDLLETATLVTLESANILNWWRHGRVPGAPRLLPLATSGDGNCLPHAASLAAYGFHDRLLALRTKVQALLSGEGGDKLTNAIKRRWRWSESFALRSAGLTPSEAEWEREWQDAVAAASAEPRPRHQPTAAPHYAGLEQLHVFALAHVMRRPVIVFADRALRDFRGDPIAPIPFGGIYLPLELAPELCSKTPILLAYDAGHFSALVPCEPLPTDGARVPLEEETGNHMPIRFSVDPGEDFRWDVEPDQKTINNLLPDEFQRSTMMAAYLDLERVECLSQNQPPEELRRSLDALSTKSTKQLNSVAKQFGSIGRSMSSKIKKNLGSMAKLNKCSGGGGGGAAEARGAALCCRVLAARAPVQEEMVKNYLNEAYNGYMAEKNRKEHPSSQPSQPRYGTGRSQFYAEADRAAHEVARGLDPRPLRPPTDRTLYLSKSTFYDDRPPSPKPCRAPLCMYYGSAANNDYCSRCARLQ